MILKLYDAFEVCFVCFLTKFVIKIYISIGFGPNVDFFSMAEL